MYHVYYFGEQKKLVKHQKVSKHYDHNFIVSFRHSNLARETDGFELTSTTTLVCMYMYIYIYIYISSSVGINKSYIFYDFKLDTYVYGHWVIVNIREA